MSLYLILNIVAISVPLLYSFEREMYFIKWWKEAVASILIVGAFFIVWDIVFTNLGVWGFNEAYITGVYLVGLPIEEWLFFLCIPYASIFVHYAFSHYFPNIRLGVKTTNSITSLLIIGSTLIALFNTDKLYTFYNFALLALLLLFCLITKNKQLARFYISFVIILIPFFVVNGILTGSFIENEVVWYNNAENLRIRIGTIPVEDIGYAFSMLFSSILLIEFFKSKSDEKNKN
tara:strand:- start:70082 stop:70780 length:699 start_codon:yes stop_codon:yes gene_type:complete